MRMRSEAANRIDHPKHPLLSSSTISVSPHSQRTASLPSVAPCTYLLVGPQLVVPQRHFLRLQLKLRQVLVELVVPLADHPAHSVSAELGGWLAVGQCGGGGVSWGSGSGGGGSGSGSSGGIAGSSRSSSTRSACGRGSGGGESKPAERRCGCGSVGRGCGGSVAERETSRRRRTGSGRGGRRGRRGGSGSGSGRCGGRGD